jgi:hypothetical protein
MKGDFDRIAFNPGDHFAAVLLQQGRLLLASEQNTQSFIQNHLLRSFVSDFAGRAWRAGDGFKISRDPTDFRIAAGHYWVDGVLCENDASCTFSQQPHGPLPETPANDVSELVFWLDCWERHVTWLNIPKLLDARVGRDTATRIQIAWQVRALTKALTDEWMKNVVDALQLRIDSGEPPGPIQPLITAAKNAAANFAAPLDQKKSQAVLDALDFAQPRLTIALKDAPAAAEPCAIPADAAYRGRTNQLLRIEIMQGGLASERKPAFACSFENGSVAFRVVDVETSVGADGRDTTQVTVESLGRDRRTGLCEGDWVELTDAGVELQQHGAKLLRVRNIDRQRRLVTLDGKGDDVNPARQALLRRWDHQDVAADRIDKTTGGILIKEGDWIDIGRGLKLSFSKGGYYAPGLYWTCEVGPAGLVWPTGDQAAQSPHGVTHHRAALASGTLAAGAWNFSQF